MFFSDDRLLISWNTPSKTIPVKPRKPEQYTKMGLDSYNLLEAKSGLDAVHALQPSCAGMEAAGPKRDFGDRIVLNGAIDSHHALIAGTPESVRADTRATLDILAPGGGYIAGASHDWILPETPLENVLAMFDTIREYRSA